MFFPPFLPSVIIASNHSIIGLNPADSWCSAGNMRLASSKGVIGSSELQRGKLGVAFCLEQKASSLPGWRRDESTALSSGGMAVCPAQLELWASIPSPPSAAGRNHGSAESVWLGSEGLDVLRSPSTHCDLFVYLHNTPLCCCAESSPNLLLFLLICTSQVITTALPSSPSPR